MVIEGGCVGARWWTVGSFRLFPNKAKTPCNRPLHGAHSKLDQALTVLP